MRDVNHCRFRHLLLELRNFDPGRDSQRSIQIGKRLVEQEHLRIANDRPSDRDALPLASGQSFGEAVEIVLQLEHPCRFLDHLVDFTLR